MTDTLTLENKVAVVTGGSRGIGRAVALELAARGAAVVVNYNSSPDAANAVVKQIEEAGGKTSSYDTSPLDLSSGKILATNGRLHEAISSDRRWKASASVERSSTDRSQARSPSRKCLRK